MFEGLSGRKPLLKNLRPHLHRADGTVSPVMAAVAVGGTAAGIALIATMLWTRRNRE